MSNSAIEVYINALTDIARVLEHHREARSAFDPGFLQRIMRDGFLQTITEADQERILQQSRSGEEFLLWKGINREKRMAWNCIGWIFPFYTLEEMEKSYEFIIRSRLEQKSWAAARQFILSCRLRLQENSIEVPTNLLKVRVMGKACQSAMHELAHTPANLRYVTKAVLDQLPKSHYLRKRIQLKIVIGEHLEPYIRTTANVRGRV